MSAGGQVEVCRRGELVALRVQIMGGEDDGACLDVEMTPAATAELRDMLTQALDAG